MMGGGGVKNYRKLRGVIYGRPLRTVVKRNVCLYFTIFRLNKKAFLATERKIYLLFKKFFLRIR